MQCCHSSQSGLVLNSESLVRMREKESLIWKVLVINRVLKLPEVAKVTRRTLVCHELRLSVDIMMSNTVLAVP